jgi:hypothetical protein
VSTARTGPAHHQVLRHRDRERRQIEHRHTGSDPPRRTGQVATATCARRRFDGLATVRRSHPRQALTGVPLLPALATSRPLGTLGPIASLTAGFGPRPGLGRWTVLARRLGRVRRRPTEQTLQLRDPHILPRDPLVLLSHPNGQRLDHSRLRHHEGSKYKKISPKVDVPTSKLESSRAPGRS